MNPNRKIFITAVSLIFAMLACSLPATAQPLTVEQQAATAIADTLTAQAVTGTQAPAATITATAAVSPTLQAGSTATGVSTPTITPTYSTPMLTVLQSTNCREGPGQDYQVVHTFLAKAKLEIIGRYDPTNFWLVKTLESKSGSCWMWGEYSEMTGSYWLVPTMTPPPTKTQPPPQAPSITKWDYFCDPGGMTFTLQWEDRATNETGYRVFRDGEMVAELPANSTSWSETIALESGESVSYYLQVYGPSGTVNTSIIKLSC